MDALRDMTESCPGHPKPPLPQPAWRSRGRGGRGEADLVAEADEAQQRRDEGGGHGRQHGAGHRGALAEGDALVDRVPQEHELVLRLWSCRAVWGSGDGGHPRG